MTAEHLRIEHTCVMIRMYERCKEKSRTLRDDNYWKLSVVRDDDGEMWTVGVMNGVKTICHNTQTKNRDVAAYENAPTRQVWNSLQ
ncbi:hypothetical protein P692DRAFT_201794267 [Suillus brevipes Sb2]|nr:hypothetical protein P692DRAFT_201794267 [Suillus brevipes Sb2]